MYSGMNTMNPSMNTMNHGMNTMNPGMNTMNFGMNTMNSESKGQLTNILFFWMLPNLAAFT